MTGRAFSFTVRGLPAAQGSKSFKGMNAQGRAILAESSKAVKPWRQDVVNAAADAIEEAEGFQTFTGPVHLIIEFYMPRPTGAPKTRRTVPKSAPDLSKLIRSTEDAMTTAGVWADDSLVIDMTVRERYAVTEDTLRLRHEMRGAGARVTVIELDPEDTWADVPLEEIAHHRFPDARIPDEIRGALTTNPHNKDVLTVPQNTTPAQVVKSITKAAGDGQIIRFEDASLITSVPGKPLNAIQEAILDTGVWVRFDNE